MKCVESSGEALIVTITLVSGIADLLMDDSKDDEILWWNSHKIETLFYWGWHYMLKNLQGQAVISMTKLTVMGLR